MMDIIKNAIKNREVLRFDYDGLQRVVEPHAVGKTLGGDFVLRAFQVAGASTSGLPNWKLFRLDRVEDTTVKVDPTIPSLAPRQGYSQGDSQMAVILGEIQL